MALLKLLVVEDDTASLELMTEVFTSLKAEVRPLGDGGEAAALLAREKFDGIFLDLDMPRLDGLQLMQQIRDSSWNRSTPIVILTRCEQPDTMHQSFLTGASFFVHKPIDRRKLTRLFRTVRGPIVENRRRSVRVPLQTGVTCKLGELTLAGRSWNVSRGGIQVEVDSLRPDDTVHISVKLPNTADAIDALGTVMWVKNGRQGIRFTKMSAQNLKQIQRSIDLIEASPQ
jgi:CheY-like chemotaxis protein